MGNLFLEALCLSEWDDKVQELLSSLEESRPEDDGTIFITSERHKVSLMFDYNIHSEEQKNKAILAASF